MSPRPAWVSEILGSEPLRPKIIAYEWAYRMPRDDRQPADEYEARRGATWAATANVLAEACETSRRSVARVLGQRGFPSSPFRVRQYW